VANLVLDGADGIVLGSETFRGKFAVACADTVLAICRQVRLSTWLKQQQLLIHYCHLACRSCCVETRSFAGS
jgi:pyruvate kinase